MQLLKPAWVSHDEKPIFSIDIHPNGERFATGGQGADSGRVVVWNMAPVLNESLENDSSVPKLLCQMDNHLGCVNVVRWSCDGSLLASGGDDKLIMVWKLSGEGGASMVFGGGGKINVEAWRCVATLRGHAGDVLDLAWAPYGGWLASCSVDNTIIIWNSSKFPEMITVLKGHSGLVKGVAWDPVRKYLASQSDDRSLRIWRVGQWTEETVITDPFEECSGTTHVLRLSWSPDGQYLVSAHAMNEGGPTAAIIERDGWKTDKDFVGHRKAITCVRFNSNILQRSIPGSSKSQQFCCCAIGSRDRKLSIWLTSLQRPLCVFHDLFSSSVLDITWSSSGLVLMACSWDGTVACIEFSSQEIGKPLSAIEKNALYERHYGKAVDANWADTTESSAIIIENPEILTLKEKASESQIKENDTKKIIETQTPISKILSTPANIEVRPINKQTETRLPDGKRRITPVFLVAAPSPTADSSRDKIPSAPVNKIETPPPSKFNETPIESKNIVRNQNKPEKLGLKIDRDVFKSKNINTAPGPRLPASVFRNKSPEVRVPLAAQTENVTTLRYSDVKYTLSVNNAQVKTQHGQLAQLQLTQNEPPGKVTWETYFGSNVLCIASTRHLVCVACEDSTLHILDTNTGSRLLPPFVLPSPAICIVLSENGRCVVLTRSNVMRIWDLWPIVDARVIVHTINLPSNSVPSSCVVGKSGEPMLTLMDGRAFIYKIALDSWLLLADPKNPLCLLSKSNPPSSNNLDNVPLATAQRSCPVVTRSHGPPNAELAHLESQLAASKALDSSTEYRHWLLALVKHLLEKGPEWRLRSILDELLGPPRPSQGWKQEIMGLKKHDLLADALALFNQHLRWQRLYMEYVEQLPD